MTRQPALWLSFALVVGCGSTATTVTQRPVDVPAPTDEGVSGDTSTTATVDVPPTGLDAGTDAPGDASPGIYHSDPTTWRPTGAMPADYDTTPDRSVTHDGHPSGHMRSIADEPGGFATITQRIRANAYVGRRVRMSGFVRASNVSGWSGLWMRVDDPMGAVLAFDNMNNRRILGTSDWTGYSIVLDVPRPATEIAFGILLNGAGEVWVADVTFEVVGEDVPVTGR